MRLPLRLHLTSIGSALILLSSCSPTPTASASPTFDLSNRPSTPVVITIVSPADGSTVHGATVHVMVSIQGGSITPTTTTRISPTVGHVHLYLNGKLVYMAYTLEQDMTVQPGLYNLYAEFVAADHFPYNPRDLTAHVGFQAVSP